MWPNPQKTAALVTFTEEILNGKLHFFVQWYRKQSTDFQSKSMALFLYDRDHRMKGLKNRLLKFFAKIIKGF